MEGDEGWLGWCQQGREEEKKKTRGSGMRMEWEERGPWAPFTHPFIQQRPEASRAPGRVLGAPGEAAVGRQALLRAQVSHVQAYGSSRDVTSGMSCALR